jgi:HSP20 family molecular chaperone IbpA
MRINAMLLFASALFVASPPVGAWGYDATDYRGSYQDYPDPVFERGHRSSGSLHLHTGTTRDGYYVRADIRGSAPEDVQVELHRGRLVLQLAQRDREGVYSRNARGGFQWKRRFRRQIQLPYDADTTRMTTSIKDSALEIFIPRSVRNFPRGPSE